VTAVATRVDVAVDGLDVAAYTIPTDGPESDGTPEWFHDHARVERMLFEGELEPVGGSLRPDPSRPGHGLELKRRDAERYRR
jgi:hypothetical protein